MMMIVPSTMQRMIPHAPSTSPMDNDMTVKFVLVALVQLIKFENKSGDELHHDNKIAIMTPVDALEDILIMFEEVEEARCLEHDLCLNSTMLVTLGQR